MYVEGDFFEVGVDEVGGSPAISYVQPMPAPMPAAAPAAAKPAAAAPAKPEPAAEPAPAAADTDGTPVTAPMPGMIVSYAKGIGDAINQGETIVVLEAMKMENALPAPAGGTVKAINYSSGDTVAKGDVLAIIG